MTQRNIHKQYRTPRPLGRHFVLALVPLFCGLIATMVLGTQDESFHVGRWQSEDNREDTFEITRSGNSYLMIEQGNPYNASLDRDGNIVVSYPGMTATFRMVPETRSLICPKGVCKKYREVRLFKPGPETINGVSYVIEHCRQGSGLGESGTNVKAEAPESMDLGVDRIAKEILDAAYSFASRRCPMGAARDIRIKVHYYGAYRWMVSARLGGLSEWDPNDRWSRYTNVIAQERHNKAIAAQRQERRAARREQQRRAVEAQRAAAAQRKAAAEKRIGDFLLKHNAHRHVTMAELCANPFVYKGETIAIGTNFIEMQTATSGYFVEGRYRMLVTGIPKGTFTKRTRIILAAKVSGRTQASAGQGSVPTLRYSGFILANP